MSAIINLYLKDKTLPYSIFELVKKDNLLHCLLSGELLRNS